MLFGLGTESSSNKDAKVRHLVEPLDDLRSFFGRENFLLKNWSEALLQLSSLAER